MKKTILALALAATGLGVSAVNAAAITSLTVTDVNGDGSVGRFSFGPSLEKYFTGNGVDMLWGGATQAVGSFSDGFIFGTLPFVPYTYGGGAVGDITGGVLTVSTLDFGGNYAGTANFNLPPDAGVTVQFVNDLGNGDYGISFGWTHYITSADDPSGVYVGFTTHWRLEGIAHTANPVPVPAAAWLMGSGLLGLAGVARRRRRA